MISHGYFNLICELSKKVRILLVCKTS